MTRVGLSARFVIGRTADMRRHQFAPAGVATIDHPLADGIQRDLRFVIVHGRAAGEMMVTITFRKVVCGTEVKIVQEGIPAVIPVEFCYLGWQESLSLLACLVEPEIPDDE